MSDSILVERKDGYAVLTVNRPKVRNALDRATVDSLSAALDGLETDAAIGAVIVTGAGKRVFVAGSDIKDIQSRTKREALEARLTRFYERLESFPRLTVAAVNGYALGGGAELALACDLRVAAESARFGFPEANLGIIPAAGGTVRLPRLVGLGRAKHLILTGEIIEAHEAERIGLVSRVVPDEELMRAASELVGQVTARGPLAIRLLKLALNASSDVSASAGLLIETLSQAITYESSDKQEGTSAFLEKRRPEFTGD